MVFHIADSFEQAIPLNADFRVEKRTVTSESILFECGLQMLTLVSDIPRAAYTTLCTQPLLPCLKLTEE